MKTLIAVIWLVMVSNCFAATNLFTVIGPSQKFQLKAGAGGGGPIDTNPAPRIAIEKVAADLVVDVEPCEVNLTFDGTNYLLLGRFYQPTQFKIFRDAPKLVLRADRLDKPPVVVEPPVDVPVDLPIK